MQYGTLITLAGLQLMAQSQAQDIPMDIVEIAVGDGGGQAYEPDMNMTALRHECWRGKISDKQAIPEQPGAFEFCAIIPPSAGGFWIREVAAYDSAGNMTHIGNYPDAFKAAPGSGAESDFPIIIQCVFTNADQVSLEVDPTATATREWVQREFEEKAQHNLARINHGLGCYPGVRVLGALQYGASMGGAGDGPAGGTDMRQIPCRVIWHDKDSLTIQTIRPVAELGAAQLVQTGAREYIITFEGDALDSLYIELTGAQESSGGPSQETISIQNLVLSKTPPTDTTAIWGEIN